MKIRSSTLGTVIILAALSVWGQGTFVFDQQSSMDETPPIVFGSGIPTSNFAPTGNGQSFTPGLNSIDFIRLMVADGNAGDGLGAGVFVNLRSGSMVGSIIATTETVRMNNGFQGATTFPFANSVALTPGVTYYFEPLSPANNGIPPINGPWSIAGGQYNYPGGSGFLNGVPAAWDYWFREGIVVPEPSSAGLLLMAGTAFWMFRRGNRR